MPPGPGPFAGIEVEVRGGDTPRRKRGQSAEATSDVGAVRVDWRTAAYFACQVTTGSRVCWYPAFASYNIFRVAYWPFRAVDGRIPYF